MNKFERTLLGILAAGVWSLVAIQAVSQSYAQEDPAPEVRDGVPVQIHATDIVGLSAFVQQTVRDHQLRPQSMPGLDQYIRSVVRNCRVNGSISGGRLSATSISC